MQRDAASFLSIDLSHRRVFTENRHLSEGMKVLPREALWVEDPIFVALGVATFGFVLFENPGPGGTTRPFCQLRQLCRVLGLKTQVVDARFMAARRDREIDTRIREHPFGIIRPLGGRLGAKQIRVELYAGGEVLDGNMHVEALHRFSAPLKFLALNV